MSGEMAYEETERALVALCRRVSQLIAAKWGGKKPREATRATTGAYAGLCRSQEACTGRNRGQKAARPPCRSWEATGVRKASWKAQGMMEEVGESRENRGEGRKCPYKRKEGGEVRNYVSSKFLSMESKDLGWRAEGKVGKGDEAAMSRAMSGCS
eukprot:Gb_24870 [translate_table: standard]